MGAGGIVAGIGGIVVVIVGAFFLTGGLGTILQEISDSDGSGCLCPSISRFLQLS